MVRLFGLVLVLAAAFSFSEEFNNQEGERFQKSQASGVKAKAQELIEDKALILLQQKFLNEMSTEPLWAIDNYPVPQTNGQSPSPSTPPVLQIRVNRHFAPTDGTQSKLTLGNEADYIIDESGFGAIAKSLDNGHQTGYLGVDNTSSQEYYTGQNRSSQSVTGVPFKIIEFVRDINNPSLVSSLLVQVGKTLAEVPISRPPLAPEGCKLIPSVNNLSENSSANFNLLVSGVVTSAVIQGTSLPVPSEQSVIAPERSLGTVSLTAPNSSMNVLTNVVQEPESDYANGEWTVSGRVTGPVNDGGVVCSAKVFVRVYKPKKPECTLTLNPNTVEPGEKSTATLTCKNPVTSATIQGTPVALSPPSTLTQSGSATLQVTKAETDQFDVITALANRDGVGSTTVTTQLFYKQPLPPTCALVADPPRVSLCNPASTLRLDCINRVDSISIKGTSVAFTKGADGHTTAFLPISKSGPNLETFTAVVTNKWNVSPSSPTANLEAILDPPTCSLTASPSNSGSYIKFKSVNSGFCLDNSSLAPMTQFTQQDCSGSVSFKLNKLNTVVGQPDTYQIKNVASNLCLDVRNGSRENGDFLQQYQCQDNNRNQQFELVSLGSNNTYQIKALVSGKSLDVVNVSSAPGAVVQQWDYLGGNNQKWQIVSPTLLRAGDRVDLTVSTIQGCFDPSQVKIQGTPVSLVNGTAMLQYPKSLSTDETLQASIGAPGEITGSCTTSIQGASDPKASLTSTKECLDFNDTTQLTLTCSNSTTAYLEGRKVALGAGGQATTSLTKNQCGDDLIEGVCNGPGGQARASLNLPLCAVQPQCTLEPDTAIQKVGVPLRLVLNCTGNVTAAKIMDEPVSLVNGKASISYTPSGPDPEDVLASVENTACIKKDVMNKLLPIFDTCKWSYRYPPSVPLARSVIGMSSWTDTGVDLIRGQSIQITATGTIDLNGAGLGGVGVTANGIVCSSPNCRSCLEITDFYHGVLIGKIGEDGIPFQVGNKRVNISDPDGGRLYLAANNKESCVSPNSAGQKNPGSFLATISGEYFEDVIKPANGFMNLLYDTVGGREYQTKTVSVSGSAPSWTDSGLDIDSRSWLTFRTTGKIDIDKNSSGGIVAASGIPCAGGTTAQQNNCKACRSELAFNRGALLAKLGDNGAPFYVGPAGEFPINTGGRLFLLANNINCASAASSQSFSVAIGTQPSQTNFFFATVPALSGGESTSKNQIVLGNAPDWTDTGVEITANHMISFSSTGTVDLNGSTSGGTVNPDGQSCILSSCRTGNFKTGALLGKIGSGAPFLIGHQRFWASFSGETGRLYLKLNDNSSNNNTGAFNVDFIVRDQKWTDSEITVEANSFISFQASGLIDINGIASGGTLTAQGQTCITSGCFTGQFKNGSLLGKVGNQSAFLIGTRGNNVSAGNGGKLYFLVNDINPSDNSGRFEVSYQIKATSDRYKNLNKNAAHPDFGQVSFSDAANGVGGSSYQRDEAGDYDVASIYQRDFDDSYDVIVSRTARVYKLPNHRVFFTKEITQSNDSFNIEVFEVANTPIDPNNTSSYNFGNWSKISQPVSETTLLQDCQPGDPNCEGFWAKSGADAWWFQIGPKDDPQCEIQKLYVREAGCFTGDTEIQMASGKYKKISELREKELVWNPHFQTGVRIKRLVKGPEKKSLYRVRVANKEITVTEDHPFLTEKGWVQARELKKGLNIFGEGEGIVVSEVTKLKYEGPQDVWNFELDTDEPLAHVIIANGIPTGDLATQIQIKKGSQSIP